MSWRTRALRPSTREDLFLQPFVLAGPGGDAAIVRIKETNTSVAMSLDGNGRYCSLSPREGARLIVAGLRREAPRRGLHSSGNRYQQPG